MAFSDLCQISNAFKTVENEADQSERIMEENSMVRDLITKILDETGPAEGNSSIQPPEKSINGIQGQFKDATPNQYMPPANYNFQNFNFGHGENYNFAPNGFGNGYVYENDASPLLGIDAVEPSTEVTPEQLNLLRLAAQEIGGAQFVSPAQNKYEDKFYNFFEANQRSSLPEANVYQNYNRTNSLNLDMNFNANANYDNPFVQRYQNKFENQNQDPSDILGYLNQLNISLERRDDTLIPNNVPTMPIEMNGHYQNEDFKLQDERNKVYFNRFQPPPKNFNPDNNFYVGEMMSQMERNNQTNFDFANQTPVSGPNGMNFKPNGYHQNEYMQRRDMNQMPRDGYQNGNDRNFDMNGQKMQQAVMLRQNQEIARQMSLLMRNRPPPNQLNVDVSFLHDNAPYNVGIGALLGPNSVPQQVLPSPMLDVPLLAPFYAMRNMRTAATSSGILHARLDACYEQWRQLERERKRTEARLALAYPGRCVSSSNSIPVPRLPPCPTRVDRLTVDMLREHTKVLTLMGKMETLRASVCVAQNKKLNKPEDGKITVLKRGQDVDKEKEGANPATFDPSTWREDLKNISEIAPHSEVESAMLAWRGAVAGVQAARRRELQPHHRPHAAQRQDPILQLSEAVRALCLQARRARAAMWCDLTYTVALAALGDQGPSEDPHTESASATQPQTKKPLDAAAGTTQTNKPPTTNNDSKEDKPTGAAQPKSDPKPESNNNTTNNNNNKQPNKPTDKEGQKNQQRRTQNYRKLNNNGRNDFYKNQRYDNNRFMHNNRQPYYLATGPIN